MDIGIPVEQAPSEYRVGLTPQGVRLLTEAGHRCYVEQGAGEGAGFKDSDFERSGATIVYGSREVYGRSDLVLKVSSPNLNEADMLRDGQTICAFWHLAARPREVINTLIERQITAVAYEAIENEDGLLPVLRPLSEIAGLMTAQVAARYCQNDSGGTGVLLSGVMGVPASRVMILGAGTVGIAAARAFYALGADVLVLDNDLERLRRVDLHFDGRVKTMVSHDFNIAREITTVQVLIGAVLVPRARTPRLVTREMVRSMRPGSVVIDVAIDQGGCIETSRPTSHFDPTFTDEGVIHYCVPNISGVVARTATHAYLNVAWPYIRSIAEQGVMTAAEHDPDFARGVVVHQGNILDEQLAELLRSVAQ
ncbi:MAG: alanine dehydrogenase [Chloroflexi bacterium]|nr:alanine dehydrogenase [Chloroflexota bacterium]